MGQHKEEKNQQTKNKLDRSGLEWEKGELQQDLLSNVKRFRKLEFPSEFISSGKRVKLPQHRNARACVCERRYRTYPN